MKVTVSGDNDENERIVVEARADTRIDGYDLERGGRYAVPPDADGLDAAIMMNNVVKLKPAEDDE